MGRGQSVLNILTFVFLYYVMLVSFLSDEEFIPFRGNHSSLYKTDFTLKDFTTVV